MLANDCVLRNHMKVVVPNLPMETSFVRGGQKKSANYRRSNKERAIFSFFFLPRQRPRKERPANSTARQRNVYTKEIVANILGQLSRRFSSSAEEEKQQLHCFTS